MSESFNGYHVWLGIPPGEQPPNHYRLLGIALFETDLDVIDHAADRQMAHVRTFQSGRNAGLSQQILNELAAARVCLLNPERKTEYDAQLRTKVGPSKVTPVPVGKALPVAQAVAAPVAAPVAGSMPRVAPLAPADELDDIEVDLDSVVQRPRRAVIDDDDDLLPGPRRAPVPTIQVRTTGGRLVDRDARLMRAIVYILTGVAILVVILVLYGMIQRMVGTPNFREWFTAPQTTSPGDEGTSRVPELPAPSAPAPRPPAGAAAPSS
jgi:hypothetical protein